MCAATPLQETPKQQQEHHSTVMMMIVMAPKMTMIHTVTINTMIATLIISILSTKGCKSNNDCFNKTDASRLNKDFLSAQALS